MSLVARDVIDAARDRHAAFDRARVPDKGALRYLSAKVRELHGRITQIDDSTLVETDETLLPLANFDDGIDLLDNRTIASVAAMPKGTDMALVDVELLPYELRNDWRAPRVSAYIRGNVLYLAGDASRWSLATSIVVSYVATPEELTTLRDEIPLPDAAELCLTEAVALYMAGRVPGMDPTAFVARAESSESRYLADVANRLAGVTYFVRDVMR